MTRLQKNVSVFQGGQMTPLALACGRPCPILTTFGNQQHISNSRTVRWRNIKILKLKNLRRRTTAILKIVCGHNSAADCLISVKFCMKSCFIQKIWILEQIHAFHRTYFLFGLRRTGLFVSFPIHFLFSFYWVRAEGSQLCPKTPTLFVTPLFSPVLPIPFPSSKSRPQSQCAKIGPRFSFWGSF